MKRGFISLFFLFLLAVNTYAIGISPSSTVLNFEPNYKTTFTFYASNNRDSNVTVQPYVKGDLEKYIQILDPDPVIVVPRGYMEFEIELNLPPTLNRPGIHKTFIGIAEIQSGKNPGSGAIVAYTSAEAILDVKAPYPDKYATADLIAENVNLGEIANFKINVENLGEKTINSTRGTVTIEEGDKIIKQLKTNFLAVATKQIITLPLKVETEDMKGGEYKVITVVDYDGLKATDEDSFRVGELFVNLTNYSNYFETNSINRWDFFVQNRWNKLINSLYIDVRLLQNGEELNIDVKTPTIGLPPWEYNRLVGYWDTSGLAPGEYDAKIRLNYDNKTSDNLVKIRIGRQKTKLEKQIPLLIEKIGLYILILIIISLVLITDVLWLFWASKHRKKDENK